ncbi:anaerobic sulfatase maturase [Clostridium omnivorum]|uniref:Radical SAM/SPASM domain-containing protein n=1 Tax=Clostridium omnivorum TaxID=1604902 RepID=A0ABQ5N713_9CLOT|nr:anaerobic sulfatase maturase [Clostridium sp. E14]GLC30894.1 radical SAM/SPASM domain-containing protein [Clostridium sp. E14]
MPPISVLIKPASSGCNLKCKYCFYNDVAENRQVKSYGNMSEDTLEQIVKKTLEFADIQCNFAFQGGEPTLVGLDFYKKVIEFEKRYNKKNVRIVNTIQTNGISIDESFGRFLSENNFLVGLSIDGYKDLHDKNRVDYENRGTFSRVMKAVEIFNRYGVEYNILYVVTSESARHANKIYGFFKKNNFRYIQFIPCLDPLEEKGGYGYSLKPEIYGQFLKNTFDLWYKDILNNEAVSIRYFDNLLRRIMGYNTESCGMNGICSCQFVIEANGGVYPCDFYVTDQWYMGNIIEVDIETLSKSSKALEFIKSSNYICEDCRKCQWLNLCRGGCRREREPFYDGKPGLNKHCKAYDEFFNYSVERFYNAARYITNRR